MLDCSKLFWIRMISKIELPSVSDPRKRLEANWDVGEQETRSKINKNEGNFNNLLIYC